MRGIFILLLGVGLGWLIRSRPSSSTYIPSKQPMTGTLPMADATVAPSISPLQAFLAAYQQASKTAWEALGAIHTRLESGDNAALEAQASALEDQIQALALIARDRAVQLLAASGAIPRLNGLAQTLTDRAAELPAATDAVQAARSVVSATEGFVTFFA